MENYPNQQPQFVPQPKDPNTAFLLELILGFFGLLGIGYIYVGKTNDGLVRLVVWLIFVPTAWCISILLTSILIGCLCMVAMLGIQIAVPIWSALELKKQLEMEYAAGRPSGFSSM